MITNSNLYAEKVFSEHPLALWPLDDNLSFLQLLTDSKQVLTDNAHWSISNLESIDPQTYFNTPIPTSNSFRFILSSSSSYITEITSLFTLNS